MNSPAVSRAANGAAHRSSKVSHGVAKRILNEILAGHMQPGSVLQAEAEMLQSYGVGRASIREALRILEVHGVIHMKPGPRGGPVVAAINAHDFGRSAALHFNVHGVTMREIIQARLQLEPMLARMAAERLTEDGAETLRGALGYGEEVADDPGTQWAQASVDYHELVGRLAGNTALSLMVSSLAAIVNARIRPLFPAGKRDDVLKAHRRIVDAILAGNGPLAERRMRTHLEALGQRMAELFPGLLEDVIEWN